MVLCLPTKLQVPSAIPASFRGASVVRDAICVLYAILHVPFLAHVLVLL